jgi:hypothetical protein
MKMQQTEKAIMSWRAMAKLQERAALMLSRTGFSRAMKNAQE